jgi:Domain of unknown function (DUF4389)
VHVTDASVPLPPQSSTRRNHEKPLLLVLGSLLALVALVFLLAGGALLWAHGTQRDDDGYYTTSTQRLATPTPALTVEDIDLSGISDLPDWLVPDGLGTVKIDARSADRTPLFVGIAPAAQVDRFLAGVAHDRVTDVGWGNDSPEYERTPGRARAPDPSQVRWVAQARGPHAVLSWKVREGKWAAVTMNADGSRSVAADVKVGGKAGFVLPLALVLLGLGAAFGIGAAGLLFAGMSTPGGGEPGAPAAAGAVPGGTGGSGGAVAAGGATPVAAEEPYPVRVDAGLDEPLSRWMWLVKWFLAIPHWIVLAFLWIAVGVLAVFSWFAILFTGRYPRSIHDFTLGVMRWSWRATAYATHAISTDRYPPFSLDEHPDYPARLDVPYVEQHDRLTTGFRAILVIPHFLILGLLYGGAWTFSWGWGWADGGWFFDSWPGLVTVLALVAGVVLLVTGRYPRDVFKLVVGINRWFWRATAYLLLLRDEYPPFRLEP